MHIYKTTNLLNGKIYVGQTSKNLDTDYLGSGKVLIKAVKKYGKSAFKREIIEECVSKEQMNEREKYWIQYFDSINRNKGYNVSIGGEGGNLGDKVNKKISKSMKGKISVKDINGNVFSISANDDRFASGELVGVQKGMVPYNKGVPMSESQKQKMRVPKSKEHIENMSKSKIGKGVKPIICLNNGVKYNSIKEAAEKLGLTVPNVVAVLKGRAKKTKGYSFQYS